jgi:D-alanyl-D-alanine carboxypeptidase
VEVVRALTPVVVVTLSLVACGGGSASAPPSSEPSPSGVVTTVVDPTTPAATTAPTRTTAEQRAAAVESAWQRYGSPGVIAVVADGDGVWRHALGASDLAGTPADPAMTFRAASITKPVVAALALTLAADGALSLDEPVAPALRSGVLRPEPPVTLRQLLGHTAGIFNAGDESDPVADLAAIADPVLFEEGQASLARAIDDPSEVIPAEVVVAAAETHERYGVPGESYHYSNAGYQAAGLYLEAVTGRPLHQLVIEELAGPLGLERLTLAPADRTAPALRGHETLTATGEPVDASDDLRAFGNGANGGVLTTADDLVVFFRALMAGDVVDTRLLTDMRSPTAASRRSGSAYGLGLATYLFSCGRFYGHEGGVSGTASIAVVDGAGDRAAVVVLNQRGIGDPELPQLADRLLCGT